MIGVDFLGGIGANVIAQLECLVATLCYALAGVYARRFKAMGVPPVAVATGQLTAATLVMLPLVLLFEPPWLAAMPTPEAWAALAGLALVCTSFAYILYFRLLASAGATNSLLVTFLIPISAILLGALAARRAAGAPPLRRHGADRAGAGGDRRAAVAPLAATACRTGGGKPVMRRGRSPAAR